MKLKKQQGYISLVALLVIVTAGLTIGITVNLAGLQELQTSLDFSQSRRAQSLAQACVEEGLGRLDSDFSSFSTSLSFGDNSCIIEAVVSGSTAILHATGTVDIYSQKIQVDVDDTLAVSSWQED